MHIVLAHALLLISALENAYVLAPIGLYDTSINGYQLDNHNNKDTVGSIEATGFRDSEARDWWWPDWRLGKGIYWW